MKTEKARLKTIKIIEIILEEQNGFTKEEIKEGNLAEDCEGSSLFTKIQEFFEQNK